MLLVHKELDLVESVRLPMHFYILAIAKFNLHWIYKLQENIMYFGEMHRTVYPDLECVSNVKLRGHIKQLFLGMSCNGIQ